MLWKRLLLLMLGALGGFAAAGVLFLSTGNAQATRETPEPSLAVPQERIHLPASVPGTAMIAQRVSAYDGPFLEDGSDREVFEIASLLVYNSGSKELLTARITLQYPEGEYIFVGDNIPPNSWILLLEQEEKPYRRDDPIACTGRQTVRLDEGESAPSILVEDTAFGMRVCNQGGETLRNICISYKGWLSSPEIYLGVYLGGITYCTVIPQLEPGQCISLQPDHYAPGYSKVVSICGRK